MLQYDSGDHSATLAKALEVSRWSSLPARRDEAAARGKLRGIGIVTYIEACGLAPSRIARQLGARGGLFESANNPRQSLGRHYRLHRLA
jgi:aerobic carbon-monoxide dehydrogenase large subunit